MSNESSIEWTDATWNPVTGCTRVSAGCDNCYAVAKSHRLEAMGQKKYAGLTVLNKAGDRHFNGKVKCHDDALSIPLRWRKPRRIFVNSMSDLFHRDVPFDFIDRVFAVMALCPQHTFQVLTKRPERMAEWCKSIEARTPCVLGGLMGKIAKERGKWDGGPGYHWPLRNVWLGTSCEDQAAFNARAHVLAKIPAAIRFLSLEPLIGQISWHNQVVTIPWAGGTAHGGRDYSPLIDFIHWVIVGGESGPGARPCNTDWIRSIVRQCDIVGVPCFVKQLGSCSVNSNSGVIHGYERNYLIRDRKGGDPTEWPADLRVRQMPPPLTVARK